MFQSIYIDKSEDQQTVELKSLSTDELPEGEVEIDIAWSSINYKDALAITGKSPVVRKFPMVPGIDFSGRVSESSHPDYLKGDFVLLTGWGVGEKHWGGLSEKARVQADWLSRVPSGMNLKQTMSVGTAGFTAMLCVLALEENGVSPESGEIIVTGASGGVGSVALMILSKLGYNVCAVTGKTSEADYLKSLGASSILDRAELQDPGKPLQKERWAGGIDVVGNTVLANVLASTKYGGTVAACGLAGGMALPTTVAPFILRGITLAGIDSVVCPKAKRQQTWDRLAKDLDFEKLEMLSSELDLSETIDASHKMLKGEIKGRMIVRINPDLDKS